MEEGDKRKSPGEWLSGALVTYRLRQGRWWLLRGFGSLLAGD